MTLPDLRYARRLALATLTALVTGAVATAGPAGAVPVADAAPPTGQIRYADSPTAVAGSYLVGLRDGAAGGVAGSARAAAGVPVKATELTTRYGGVVTHLYDAALNGFATRMSAESARRLAAHPDVAWVEQDQRVTTTATQLNPPSWGLDRIDQHPLPLNQSYTYPNTAPNVRAYVIDTGIRFTHTDFNGQATSGYDAVDGGTADDCNGHGTHVAGTLGGQLHGVAKDVHLVAVRVLDCNGSGTYAGVVAGVNWVTANAVKPAVANMSLGGPVSTAVDSAVSNSINSGVSYSVAAGNNTGNVCNNSPARVPAAITVGASTITDAKATYSNPGPCLDLYAPGTNITSTWHTSNTATNTISGTSMATPHVAGAAALVLSVNPLWTPAQVRNYLVANATTGVPASPLLFVVN
ncbi:S8 family peptidase [Micromonospora sp. NBC_01699]|uniref:S8 family peptidase n=1 Tax=Micromonospora sp. NBC_01699 TaxID=2975984 RepID=UPI002E2DF4EB|nr:S8 family peptidase [Micromonospora sp. NBC_01699]